METGAVILIVDDEKSLCSALEEYLSAQGHTVVTAQTAKDAIVKSEEILPDLTIVDLRMPGMDGISLLEEMKRKDPNLQLIVMTGYGTVDSAVTAMRLGAHDFLEKPFKLEELKLSVDKALENQSLRREVLQLRAQREELGGVESILVGKSRQIKQLYKTIKQVAKTPASTVLISGESGTGKELVAHAVHTISLRKNKPFIEVNCAALTESLLEAELFGYEKGAFTGAATTGKRGLFEAADGGAILLDEIGEMGSMLQAKLLRVLQDKRFKKVGGLEDISVDVRIIASTNRDLEEEVAKGNFRKDLYYRLKVVPIHVPPLREHKEDIPLLTKHFMQLYNAEFGKNIHKLSIEAEKLLMEYDWPGNVRELKNVIERAVILEDGDTLSAKHLLLGTERRVMKSTISLEADDLSIANMEKKLIGQVLNNTLWRRSEAARILGINRTTLYHKIKEYGLAPNATPAM